MAVVGATAGGTAAWLSNAGGGSAHLNPQEGHLPPFHQDEYTFGNSGCSPSPDTWVDPINVVFAGPEATSQNVKSHAALPDHGGWGNHDGGQQYFWDHNQCEAVNGDQSADGGSLENRYHMRYNTGDEGGWDDYEPSLPGGGGFYTLAAVHHEIIGGYQVCDEFCVWVPCGHAVDGNEENPPGGFNMGRTELLWQWLNSSHYHPNLGLYEWANTEPRGQCGGHWDSWSDGWVRYIGMGVASGGGGGFTGGPSCGWGAFSSC